MDSMSPKSYECDECHHTFASNFSLRRHKHRQHHFESETTNTSSDAITVSSDDKSDDLSDSNMDTSSSTSSNSGNSRASDKTSDSVVDDSVFYPFVQEVKHRCSDQAEPLIEELIVEGAEKDYAINQVDQHFAHSYQVMFRKMFLDHMVQNEVLKRHPIYKTILKQAYKLHEEEGFDMDEAIRAAVSLRKHLINRLFTNLTEQGNENEEINETENEEMDETEDADDEDQEARSSVQS